MAVYVLVHGAWCGGFIWRNVADGLRGAGHRVFTPTLTGLADRSHLLGPQIDLQTHVDDVVNLIKWEELTDIILVGHSYGGMVITGVADQLPDNLNRWCISTPLCRRTANRYLASCHPRSASSLPEATTPPRPFSS